jgi:uncharacterized protein with FMN-binding domain
MDSNRSLLMEKLIRGVFALLLLVFLGACPSDVPDTTEVPSGRVGTPAIVKNPSRNYNNERIEISFTSSTSGAEFYYTLDGSAPSTDAGVKYDGPFFLDPGNENISDTPNPGSIQVRVIGIKEGLRNSSISSQTFQIFLKELIKDGDGNAITSESAGGTGVGGYYSSGQNVQVTVTVTDGLITAAYQNGYNDTASHTAEYWAAAAAHAAQFLSTMNSWEFDTVTGATFSSRAIKDGLGKAMAQILND